MAGQSSTFLAALEALPNADDKYGLLVRGGSQDGLRIVLNEPELLIGWAHNGQHLAFVQEEIAIPCLYLQKDWHGVAAQYVRQNKGQPELQARSDLFRLQAGQSLDLGIAPKANRKQQGETVQLIFQEPASRQTLDELLPQGIPEPIRSEGAPAVNGRARQIVIVPAPPPAPRRWLGYFSTLEMSFFVLGTMILTALLFFLLRTL